MGANPVLVRLLAATTSISQQARWADLLELEQNLLDGVDPAEAADHIVDSLLSGSARPDASEDEKRAAQNFLPELAELALAIGPSPTALLHALRELLQHLVIKIPRASPPSVVAGEANPAAAFEPADPIKPEWLSSLFASLLTEDVIAGAFLLSDQPAIRL